MNVDVARDQLESYADYVAEEATDEFKPSNVVNIPLVSDRRAKRRISNTLDDLMEGQRQLLKQQYDAVLDGCTGDVDDHVETYLDGEIYLRKYRGDREQEFREAVEERYRELCRLMDPVVESNADGLWTAVADVYTREEAEELLEHLLGAYSTAREFEDGIVLAVKIPLTNKEYEYTGESLRAFGVAEKRARREVLEELEDHYS